jgi:hypothetical protein
LNFSRQPSPSVACGGGDGGGEGPVVSRASFPSKGRKMWQREQVTNVLLRCLPALKIEKKKKFYLQRRWIMF